jgi:protein ImuB
VRTLVAEVADWAVVAAGVALDEPAAVFHANRVVACSPAARAEGVDVGLRRRESQARCPSLLVLQHDQARDARAWEPVVAGLEDLCPRVEVSAPGRVAFAVRGPSRYFGGDDAVARLVAQRTGASVGVADGPFAALLAARDGDGGGGTVVAPGGTPAFLAPRPVSALLAAGLPEDLVDVLARLGLRTLGAVAAVPAGDLAGRFGPDGLLAHRLAAGLDHRPPDTRAPEADLAARIELDPPAERVETAAFLARGLADELSARLDRRGLACTRLAIVAETEHGERLERLWRGDGAGGAAALGATAIADRVRWQLDGWLRGATAPTSGITLLELVPDEVVAATGRQLGFWGGSPDAAARAVRAVARITGLLGVDAVVVPERRGGRLPADDAALVPAATVDLDDEGRW